MLDGLLCYKLLFFVPFHCAHYTGPDYSDDNRFWDVVFFHLLLDIQNYLQKNPNLVTEISFDMYILHTSNVDLLQKHKNTFSGNWQRPPVYYIMIDLVGLFRYYRYFSFFIVLHFPLFLLLSIHFCLELRGRLKTNFWCKNRTVYC